MIKIKTFLNKIYLYFHSFFYNHKQKEYLSENLPKTSNVHKCSDKALHPISRARESKYMILDWLDSFKHTHFLTIQFPNNMKSENPKVSQEHLRKIMAKFEFHLLGRKWNRKHLSFIGVAEKGKGVSWHYHLLFNSGKFTTGCIQDALDKVADELKISGKLFYLEEITDRQKLHTYCMKELKIWENGMINSDRLILSKELFSIDK